MGLQSACPVLQGNPFSVNVNFCAFGGANCLPENGSRLFMCKVGLRIGFSWPNNEIY